MAVTLKTAHPSIAQPPATAMARAHFDPVHQASRKVNSPRIKPSGAFWGFASTHRNDQTDQRKMPGGPSLPVRAITTASASSRRKKMQEAGSA